jgi:hypothetical protein
VLTLAISFGVTYVLCAYHFLNRKTGGRKNGKRGYDDDDYDEESVGEMRTGRATEMANRSKLDTNQKHPSDEVKMSADEIKILQRHSSLERVSRTAQGSPKAGRPAKARTFYRATEAVARKGHRVRLRPALDSLQVSAIRLSVRWLVGCCVDRCRLAIVCVVA